MKTNYTPDWKPTSTKKKRKLSKEETAAQIAWRTEGRPDTTCDPHHVISEQYLRLHGLQDLIWDRRNRMWITRERHSQHHATKPLSIYELPVEALMFAEENGLMDFIEDHYDGTLR